MVIKDGIMTKPLIISAASVQIEIKRAFSWKMKNIFCFTAKHMMI